MSTKANPRKIPRTQADVDKAEERGKNIGMEFMANIILWILVDKHDAPREDLKELSQEISYLCDSILSGYVSYADIRRALDEEHNLKVVFS